MTHSKILISLFRLFILLWDFHTFLRKHFLNTRDHDNENRVLVLCFYIFVTLICFCFIYRLDFCVFVNKDFRALSVWVKSTMRGVSFLPSAPNKLMKKCRHLPVISRGGLFCWELQRLLCVSKELLTSQLLKNFTTHDCMKALTNCYAVLKWVSVEQLKFGDIF